MCDPNESGPTTPLEFLVAVSSTHITSFSIMTLQLLLPTFQGEVQVSRYLESVLIIQLVSLKVKLCFLVI